MIGHLVAIITESQKNSLLGKSFSPGSNFYPMQDKNYDWFISKQEVQGCTNPAFPWVPLLPLTVYKNYRDNDISYINFEFSTDILSIDLFSTLDATDLVVDINTLSATRKSTMDLLRDNILSSVPDCTSLIFSRRGGIVRQYSPTQGIVKLILPNLTESEQLLYDNVGTICNELIEEQL